jgi:hypothetical protein
MFNFFKDPAIRLILISGVFFVQGILALFAGGHLINYTNSIMVNAGLPGVFYIFLYPMAWIIIFSGILGIYYAYHMKNGTNTALQNGCGSGFSNLFLTLPVLVRIDNRDNISPILHIGMGILFYLILLYIGSEAIKELEKKQPPN